MDNRSIMDLSHPERTFLILLSISLLTGTVILHKQGSSDSNKITITENGIKKELSLKKAEEAIKARRKININEAPAWQIAELPGVGPVLAQRIVERRNRYGSFFQKEDLLDVKGVGEKKLKKIAEYILFE